MFAVVPRGQISSERPSLAVSTLSSMNRFFNSTANKQLTVIKFHAVVVAFRALSHSRQDSVLTVIVFRLFFPFFAYRSNLRARNDVFIEHPIRGVYWAASVCLRFIWDAGCEFAFRGLGGSGGVVFSRLAAVDRRAEEEAEEEEEEEDTADIFAGLARRDTLTHRHTPTHRWPRSTSAGRDKRRPRRPIGAKRGCRRRSRLSFALHVAVAVVAVALSFSRCPSSASAVSER